MALLNGFKETETEQQSGLKRKSQERRQRRLLF